MGPAGVSKGTPGGGVHKSRFNFDETLVSGVFLGWGIGILESFGSENPPTPPPHLLVCHMHVILLHMFNLVFLAAAGRKSYGHLSVRVCLCSCVSGILKLAQTIFEQI